MILKNVVEKLKLIPLGSKIPKLKLCDSEAEKTDESNATDRFYMYNNRLESRLNV